MEVRTKSAEEIIQKKLDDLSRENRYQEIISVVTQNVHQSIDKMDHVSIYLVEGDEAVIKAHYGYTRDYLKRASRIPYPKGGVWRTIIDAKPRYVADTDKDTALGKAGRDMGIKCYLVVPLFNYEKVVGTITIVSCEKNVFDEEERKLMDIVSKQISIAIRNAKQAQELKDSEELLRHNVEILSKKNKYEEIINTVARSVHSSIDLDEVLENAVDAMHENIDYADNVGIFFVEDNYAVIKANRGYSKKLFNKVKKIPRPKGFTWKTILEGKLIYCNDAEADSTIGPAGKKAGTKSYASMPIKLKGKTIACININSFQKDAFDNEDLNLLDIVARQIGVAINNATQAEALKKSEETLKKNLKQLSKKQRYEEIISTVTRNVHRSIDLKEVLENAADALGKNVDHADHVAIYLVEGDTAVLKSYTGYPKWFTAKVARIPKPVGATWKTLIDGIPRFVPDISKDKYLGPAGRKVGTKSYASMPIKHNDTTIGCINISSRTPNALDEEEIKLLEIVATQIETAINNANQAEALKRSREELRESREHFRLLVETTNVIPWEVDAKTFQYTYMGPQAEKLLGYPASKWYEEDFWPSLIHEEDRDEVVKTCKEATSALIDHELEYRMISKDGKVVWIYEMVTVISENGKAKTLRGFMIDVTERKTAEYEKQEAQ